MPEVSVVIPTIRFDDHLSLALQSVLSQSEVDFEIVLVLDGVERPQLPLLDDARIKVVQIEERSGTPNALNTGIQHSSASLIARLDADDLALPNRLRKQVDFMTENSTLWCARSAVELIDEAGEVLGFSSANTDSIRHTLLDRNCIVHSSVIYRKKEIQSIGGYSLVMQRMQDYDLFLRIAQVGEIGDLGDRLTAYRIHLNQHSRLTSPWKPYTRRILSQRMKLAQALGVSRFLQSWKNLVWFSAQVARYHGLVQAGHLRRAETPKQG